MTLKAFQACLSIVTCLKWGLVRAGTSHSLFLSLEAACGAGSLQGALFCFGVFTLTTSKAGYQWLLLCSCATGIYRVVRLIVWVSNLWEHLKCEKSTCNWYMTYISPLNVDQGLNIYVAFEVLFLKIWLTKHWEFLYFKTKLWFTLSWPWNLPESLWSVWCIEVVFNGDSW